MTNRVKRRTLRIALEAGVICLAFLWFATGRRSGASAGQGVSQKVFNETYQEFNERYFNNKLPKDTILDYSESGPNIATTTCTHQPCHIAFNEKYAQSEQVVRVFLLHELCHVKGWPQDGKWSADEYQTRFHGKKWRACMLQLDLQGAFRRELIDHYEGN